MDVSPPTPRTDWVQVFFSASGRSGRLGFLAAGAVVLGLFATYAEVVHGLPRTLTGWAVFFVLFVSACCILSRRLHDRGRAGWWSGPILWAFAAAWPRPHGILDWACVAVLAVVLIDLALLPGQRGFNRYGPVP